LLLPPLCDLAQVGGSDAHRASRDRAAVDRADFHRLRIAVAIGLRLARAVQV
jgi:hypothetical protein